mmetsp:Transcript_11061/g.13343  ORF Transcript_11061/g.13343 Transcript_11061/m.13343 type:complete len:114 (+) Transcript_11061:2851-3192(+)
MKLVKMLSILGVVVEEVMVVVALRDQNQALEKILLEPQRKRNLENLGFLVKNHKTQKKINQRYHIKKEINHSDKKCYTNTLLFNNAGILNKNKGRGEEAATCMPHLFKISLSF